MSVAREKLGAEAERRKRGWRVKVKKLDAGRGSGEGSGVEGWELEMEVGKERVGRRREKKERRAGVGERPGLGEAVMVATREFERVGVGSDCLVR